MTLLKSFILRAMLGILFLIESNGILVMVRAAGLVSREMLFVASQSNSF